jgi:hypothetical protein
LHLIMTRAAALLPQTSQQHASAASPPPLLPLLLLLSCDIAAAGAEVMGMALQAPVSHQSHGTSD